MLKNNFILIIILSHVIVFSQNLKPGFDKYEYQNLMYISARTGSVNSSDYYKDIPEPKDYKMVYRSESIGLDNLWDLWTNENKSAVISIRGTTEKPESWLANFYAAMVPAKGKIELATDNIFEYELATNPKAAVHIGWLLSVAYLEKEIVPKIKELHEKGTKDFIIMGHSQGGGIAFLMTSHLYNLQKYNKLPTDIRFKTYCSAGPKPGNLYYAYEYEAMTQEGWAYNVVNAADWVPEVPISIQTTDDFNNVNPFMNAKDMINKQKFAAKLALKYAYNQLDKPTRTAQRNYEKYLGNLTSKMIKKNINGFVSPDYYHSNHYVRTGNTITLLPDDDYFKIYPDDDTKLFPHHFHPQYLYLLNKLPEKDISTSISGLIYTPSTKEIDKANERTKPIKNKKVVIHSLLGIQVPSFTLLNAELEKNNFMTLGSLYFSRGGGFYTVFPKSRFATLFNYTTYSANKTEGQNTNSLRGTTAGTSLGFAILDGNKHQLIPFVGAVYSWFGVRISKNNIGGQSFGNYLSNGLNQQHISSNGFTANVGIHYSMKPFVDGFLGGDFVLGLRSGYYIPLNKSKWTTNNIPLNDGPKISSQGFYINILFGTGI